MSLVTPSILIASPSLSNMPYTLEERHRLILEAIKKEEGNDPIKIARHMMRYDFVSLHGPEHHLLDGALLLVALNNDGLKFDLDKSLNNLSLRAMKMPGGMCGYWGVYGSISSIGAVFSILDETGPLSNDENYKDHMRLTAEVISKMSDIGGPRCCKRNAFLSLSAGIDFANRHYKTNLPKTEIHCEFSQQNPQCIKERCPFNK